jgi:hypothetical protein
MSDSHEISLENQEISMRSHENFNKILMRKSMIDNI